MNRLVSTQTYTCGELGVCQGRTPACSGCTVATSCTGCTGRCNQGRNCTCSGTGHLPAFAFAPGVIDHEPTLRLNTAKWIVRWVWFTAAISAAAFVWGLLS